MGQLYLLMNASFKLVDLHNDGISSFRILKSSSERVIVRVTFKSIDNALSYCMEFSKEIIAASNRKEEMKEWGL